MVFCRNCGNQMDDIANVCVRCGVQKGRGNYYCPNCGHQTAPDAAMCTQCGIGLGPGGAMPGAKSKLTAGLLGIFLGAFGVHNFYLGYTGKAVAQLLITVLSCFILSEVSYIWGLIEGIMILTGSINTDGHGQPLGE